jgi:hypothetical protein
MMHAEVQHNSHTPVKTCTCTAQVDLFSQSQLNFSMLSINGSMNIPLHLQVTLAAAVVDPTSTTSVTSFKSFRIVQFVLDVLFRDSLRLHGDEH